jgi:hypothetical protein
VPSPSQPVVGGEVVTPSPANSALNPQLSFAPGVQPSQALHIDTSTLFSADPVVPNQKSSRLVGRKKWLLLAGGVVATLGLISGVVFDWYLPNTPASVWNTGINRSGKALDSFVQTAASAKQLETYKTSTVLGTADAHLGGAAYSGNFSSTFDATSLNGSASFTMRAAGGAAKTLSAKVMSQVPAGKLYPDVYLQVNGLKSLGLDAFAPSVTAYDGQWLLLSSDYLQSLGGETLSSVTGDTSQASASDVAELIKVASGVTKDYLFTTDSNKAVLAKKSFVAKEVVDGQHVYHYTAGVNAAHAKAYCTALVNAVMATTAYAHVTGKSGAEVDDAKKSAATQCSADSPSSTEFNDTLDVWVDGHYKLIYKIRAYQAGDKSSYTDVGQLYKGGNAVSLFVDSHDANAQSDARFTLDANLDTAATKATIVTKSTGSSPYDLSVALQLKASSSPVTITKPSTATPVQALLNSLGITTPGASSSTSSDSSASSSSSSSSSSGTSASTSTTPTVQDEEDEANIGQVSQVDDTDS